MARQVTPATQEAFEVRYLVGERVSNKSIQTRLTDMFTAVSDVQTDVTALLSDTDTLKTTTASILVDTGSIEDKVDIVDTNVDAIKVKTDALPANTAQELTDIDTAIATVDTVVDAIKVKTDGLPADTAAALTSISGKVDTVDTVVDAIKAVTDQLPDGGALTSLATASSISSLDTKVTTIDTVVDGIQADLDNSTDGLGALKVLIDSVQATATAIQNNTRLTASIPQELQVPTSGSTYIKMFVNMYDSAGSKEDPDNNDIAVILTNVAGTDLTTTRLFKTNTGTALDNSTEFSGSKKLERDSLGRYFFFYKNTSTDTVDTLNVQIKYNESAVLNGSDRSMRIVEQLGSGAATVANQLQIISDVAVVDGNVDAIKAVTDLLPDGGALTSLASASALAVVDGNVDAIKAKTDNLPADTATVLAGIETKVDTVDTVVDAIKAKTDALPANTAQELTDIDTAIATVDTVVDAIKVKTDNLPADTAAEFTAVKGSGFAATDSLKNINDNVKSLSSQKAIRASKNSTAIAQGASITVDLDTAAGWNSINAILMRLDVTVNTGASTSYDVELFEDSGLTKSIMLIQDIGASGLFLGDINEVFTNQDTVPGKHVYVRITNNTDAGSSSFTVKLRGLTLHDALA